jgi:hypothetical protein
MKINWLDVRFGDHTWILWRSKAAGGFLDPGGKGKCLLGPNFWYKDKRVVEGGGGAPPKVLEAYMGEAALQNNPPGVYLAICST